MRIIRFIADDGRVLHGKDLGDGTAGVIPESIFEDVAPSRRGGEIAVIRKRLAPLEPPDIICVGRNYGEAARQARGRGGGRRGGRDDDTLEVFLKPTTALQHPEESIVLPRFTGADGRNIDSQVDAEGELAVVLARETRNVSDASALEHVLGYTLALDVTARLFQTPSGPPLWMRGKGFDGFCPLGPCIITRDEVPDPQSLTLRTMIDDVITREASTGEMVWSVAEIIACLSRHMTMRAGTVILTGAPPQIEPAVKINLREGAKVLVEAVGLVALRNIVRDVARMPV